LSRPARVRLLLRVAPLRGPTDLLAQASPGPLGPDRVFGVHPIPLLRPSRPGFARSPLFRYCNLPSPRPTLPLPLSQLMS
jgi:hypothetical protein